MEEQSSVDVARSRQIFERAVLNVPPVAEKRFWKRYIYLWLNFAIFEEMTASQAEKALQVYQRALNLVPHTEFTFAKLWIQYAQFLVRQQDLTKARQLFGNSIGKCPRPKIFKAYAEMEM